jgi:hypothetical protein
MDVPSFSPPSRAVLRPFYKKGEGKTNCRPAKKAYAPVRPPRPVKGCRLMFAAHARRWENAAGANIVRGRL